MNLFIDIIL